jgi:hypothetical protein
LPAVAQIGWAVNLARDAFPLPARFSALRSLKFLRVVQPPVRLTIELTLRDDGRPWTSSICMGVRHVRAGA